MTPNDTLVNIVKSRIGTEARVDIQNRLMRITDREVALAMMYMKDGDRSLIFGLLPQEKVKRIRAELALHERLRIRYPQYRMAIDHVTGMLNDEKSAYALRSYLKPRH